jgi:hypothetical protein
MKLAQTGGSLAPGRGSLPSTLDSNVSNTAYVASDSTEWCGASSWLVCRPAHLTLCKHIPSAMMSMRQSHSIRVAAVGLKSTQIV